MNKYPKLPPLLTSFSGNPIKTVRDWEDYRRPEILSAFRSLIYGYEPSPEISVQWKLILSRTLSYGTREDIVLCTSLGDIPFCLYLPKAEDIKETILYLRLKGEQAEAMPIVQALERNIAVAVLWTEDVASDNKDSFQSGIFRKLFSQNIGCRIAMRANGCCGAIGAWSWALSRVMDYLEKDTRLRNTKTVLAGFSRGAKTVLWTGARDRRFHLCAAFHSGCTGSCLSRWREGAGETIDHITTVFPYWFAENYGKYDKREEMLPVDQHMLLALHAPNLILLTGARDDPYAGFECELESARAASECYALYGNSGLQIPDTPEENVLYGDGSIGYFLGTQGHCVTPEEWNALFDFMSKKL